MTAPAPAPSAEARRLIDGFEMAVQARFKGAGDVGWASAGAHLSAYVAGLEAEVERLREWSHKQAMDIITLGQMAAHPTKDQTHA